MTQAYNDTLTKHSISLNEYQEKLNEQEDRLNQLTKELETTNKKLPVPKFKKGEHVLLNGFKEVEILDIIPIWEDKGFWIWKSRSWYFTYKVKHCNTATVELVDRNGVKRSYAYSDAPFQAGDSELSPFPINYEAYLCHLLENYLEEKRR